MSRLRQPRTRSEKSPNFVTRWRRDEFELLVRFPNNQTTTRYRGSRRSHELSEEIFGWMKTVGGLRRTRYRGLDRTQLHAHLVAAAYNLLRIARLCPAPA
jgi:Transposase DDE domain